MRWLNYNKTVQVCMWLNYWIIVFWLIIFVFFFNSSNFINLIIISELVWVLLYTFTISNGLLFDDLNFYSFAFFFLGLAGLEFSFALLLLLLFKSLNLSFNLKFNEKNGSFFFQNFNNVLNLNRKNI